MSATVRERSWGEATVRFLLGVVGTVGGIVAVIAAFWFWGWYISLAALMLCFIVQSVRAIRAIKERDHDKAYDATLYVLVLGIVCFTMVAVTFHWDRMGGETPLAAPEFSNDAG